MIKTKEDFIKACEKFIELKKAMIAFDRATDMSFCIVEHVNEIHMSSIGGLTFDGAVNLLQPTVTYNPNYSQISGMKYFYLPIDGKQIKVFALWSKQH